MATPCRVYRRPESVARMVRFAALLVGIAFIHIHGAHGAAEYFGRYIGSLSRLHHSVSGEVYAVDARTLHLRDFTYDGEGPAAFFYAGNTKAVGPGGFFVRDENGSNGVLKMYNKKHITITLPEGKTLHNIKWFSVWCDEFEVNFGDIPIPRGLDFPKPQKISPLSGVHAVSSENIVVVDAQTLLIPSFSYDGEAPDAKFWVGRGPKPSPQGIKVPDENGKTVPLRKYDRKTIVLTLPGELTIFDIGHFGVWCEAFTVDFGHVQIPPALNVPPSLKMLGVSPQSKLNCEVLSDDLAFEVRWAVAGDSVVIQLVAKLENGEYMSFGLSGDDSHSEMVGGDVVVAWVDQRSLNGFAQDYYLDAKSQCAGTRGSCPDYKIESNTESVRLLNAALVNGYSIVTYQRPLKAHDGLDKPILTNQSQPIIWAVGPLNPSQEVSYHSVTSKGDIFIDFGRAPRWNCPIPETDNSDPPNASHVSEDLVQHESVLNSRNPQQAVSTEGPAYKTPPPPQAAPRKDAWVIPPIQCNEPEDGVFYAQLGPTGGKRGYPAITGHVGWGISFYINGLLIPEIHVVRGQTYTFVVESGNDPNVPAKYHPFYITDDPVGGYQHKTPEERRKVNILAGAELNKHGEVVPTGVGRLCNWTPDAEHPSGDDYASFGAYQRTLTLVCDQGDPGVVQWTPDKDTPDTVYYQCFTHRYLGWKIIVHDECDHGHHGAASEPVGSFASPEGDELLAKPSVLVTTRIKPDFPPQSINDNFKKEGIHDTKETSFADKPSYFVVQHNKQDVKGKFPYEIYKPSTNENRPNMSETVIPVKEDIEDQESTTFKMTVVSVNSSSSVSTTLGGETPLPLVKGPNNRNPPPPPPPYRGTLVQAPQNFGQLPPIRRPVAVMVRRPVQPLLKPNNQHIPLMNRPQQMIHHSPSQQRPIIVKKPIMRIPQRPIGVNLPPPQQNQRPLLGPTIATYPQPPQPPPMPSRPPKPAYVHKFKKPINSYVTAAPDKTKYKILPSQMISQKPEESATRIPIAVNTGFNPGSLVIESGFKPIIASQQAEKRVSEVEYDDEENNEGVINMDSLDEQKSQTEMFEPMFIPSPLDSNVKHVKKATTEPVKKVRKPYRQVLVRRPVYNDEPLFRSEPDDELGESAMANEKTEVYYLPGRQTTVLSYDGTELSNDEAPPLPPNHKPESKSSEQLKKEPQFGPFKGEAPPPVPVKIPDVPQLHLHGEDGSIASALPIKTSEPLLAPQKNSTNASESDHQQEVITVIATTLNEEKQEQKESPSKREKRDAHHQPGHIEEGNEHHDHEDHSEHDHFEHDHSKHSDTQKTNSATSLLPAVFLLFPAIVAQNF